MKKTILLAISALLLIAIIAGAVLLYNKYSGEYKPESIQPENTIPAPDFTIFDMDGNAVKLSDYRGKPVVMNFWTSWCYYCKEEMPDFDAMAKKYPNVQFLMINATDGVQETEAMARNYIAQERFGFDVFFDLRMEAVNTYGITGFPTTYFINEKGEIVTRAGGMLSATALESGIKKIGG